MRRHAGERDPTNRFATFVIYEIAAMTQTKPQGISLVKSKTCRDLQAVFGKRSLAKPRQTKHFLSRAYA